MVGIQYILIPLFLSMFLDVHMTSPPTSPSHNLQGASRTIGGFSHGWAMGNAFNHADVSDIQMDLNLALSIPAKIYLYESLANSSQVDSAKVKLHCIIKTDVSNTFASCSYQTGMKIFACLKYLIYLIFSGVFLTWNRIKYADSHL
jgi:hypothetical protein